MAQEDAERYIEELMVSHNQYHRAVENTNYVTVGSIIGCTYGSILAKLTADEVTEVYVGNGAPVMTCADCATGINIPTFGTCLNPEATQKGLPGKKFGTWGSANGISGGTYMPGGYKCIPLLAEGWKQPDGKDLIWRDATGTYSYALKDIAVLVCRYGGTIGVVEVNKGAEGSDKKIADKYYAADDAKIRATPNGQQIGGNRIFKKGAIIKVVDPSKEPEKVDGSDESWIKVYYDGNNVGYVALRLLDELPKPVTGHTFNYKWEKSQHVTQDFKDKTTGVAKSLGIVPDDLMAVMAFESYGCNPAQGNMAGGSAVGLVQFMPDVAEELNTTSAELITMSGVEQLDYVFGYFYPYKGRCKSLGDVYMRVLWPSGVGENESYVLYSKGSKYYAANAGLDVNNDGDITKKEAVQAVIDKRQEYI